jgi:hypothetical protein
MSARKAIMNLRLLTIITFLTVFMQYLCLADLAFYSGSLKIDRAGSQVELKQRYKVFVVIDYASGEIAKINYFPPTGGLKPYTVDYFEGLHTNDVSFSKRKSYTILAKADTLTNSNSFIVTSAFAKGSNSRLTVKTGVTVSFPRILTWVYRGVSASSGTGEIITWEETGVVAFDKDETIHSNDRGETLTEAAARLGAFLDSRGYTAVVPN